MARGCAPIIPNKLTALDLVKLLLEHGADPHKPFTGQFHSTSMPNSDRFDNSPFFRSAITSVVEALKVFIAQAWISEHFPSRPPAPPEKQKKPDGASRKRPGNPNVGRTAAMVSMTGGRGRK